MPTTTLQVLKYADAGTNYIDIVIPPGSRLVNASILNWDRGFKPCGIFLRPWGQAQTDDRQATLEAGCQGGVRYPLIWNGNIEAGQNGSIVMGKMNDATANDRINFKVTVEVG